MGTSLYLRSEKASGSIPNPNSRVRGTEVAHNWPIVTYSCNMSTVSNASSVVLGGNFLVDPLIHFSHVRTFVSARLVSNSTFSSANPLTFSARMGASYHTYEDRIIRYWNFDVEPPERVTETISVLVNSKITPEFFIYSWNEMSGGILTHTISDLGTRTDFNYGVNGSYESYTYSLAPENVIVSAGDRLVLEIHYKQHPFGGNAYAGYLNERFVYNDSSSYLSIPQQIYFLENPRRTSILKYNVKNKVRNPRTFKYDFGYDVLTRNLESIYNLNSYRYITIYMETESAARGRVSLNVMPKSTISFENMTTDYSQKWVLPEPSMHKFFMIDDFEGYDDLGDTALHWTVSDGEVTFSALKTFSAVNLSDYEILTLYARGSTPTTLRARFGDKYGASSGDIRLPIADQWQRYEGRIQWGDCNPAVVTSFNLESEYNSKITVDDIFLLDYNSYNENTEWMKMALTNMDFGREQKMATFEIPFKQMEVIQFAGEKNGLGEFTFRSIDSQQSEFLDECLKMNTPLYFRYKNMGMPLILRDTGRTFKQIIPKQVSSEITVPFYEIYDYSEM